MPRRYHDGEDWHFHMQERADRIGAHVPWDETSIPPSRRRLVALLRAEREAREMGLASPTPRPAMYRKPGGTMEED